MNNAKTMVAAFLLGIVAVAWSGCAAPEASVQSADLRGVSLQEIDVGLTLDLRNPNEFSVPLEGIDWGLSLFDYAVADGRANPGTRIPANGSTDVDVPISVRLSDLSSTVRELRSSSRIPYEVDGTCHFEVAGGTVSVDFSRDGHWNNPVADPF